MIECRCVHSCIAENVRRGGKVWKFRGKWPHHRFLGMQEPVRNLQRVAHLRFVWSTISLEQVFKHRLLFSCPSPICLCTGPDSGCYDLMDELKTPALAGCDLPRGSGCWSGQHRRLSMRGMHGSPSGQPPTQPVRSGLASIPPHFRSRQTLCASPSARSARLWPRSHSWSRAARHDSLRGRPCRLGRSA